MRKKIVAEKRIWLHGDRNRPGRWLRSNDVGLYMMDIKKILLKDLLNWNK